jgi:hypothetical protein
MTQKIAKEFKGNVGIFLVASKLSAMNIIALTTSRNTKGYDIVVLNPETNKGKGIQVKCTDKEDFPVVSALFRTMHEELRKTIICDFVFVDISSEQTRYFILSKDEVINIIETRTKEWYDKSKHRKPPEESNKKILHAFKLSSIEKYENNWNQILQDLL